MSVGLHKNPEYCDLCDKEGKLFFKKRTRNLNILGMAKNILLCAACANKVEGVR